MELTSGWRPAYEERSALQPDFDQVYRDYAPKVVQWAARLGGPGIDLEDVVQEVFTVVDRRLASFKPTTGKLSTWLFRITANVVRYQRRRNKIWRWVRGSAREAAGKVPSTDPTPLEDAERHQTQARVYRILDAMNDRYRTAMILFEIEQLSGEETAARMGIKPANIWVLLHRARADFVRRVHAEGGSHE